jgi:hypothetical protein
MEDENRSREANEINKTDRSDEPEKDNKEFLLSRRRFLMSSIAAMGLASMTPLLSVARAASPEKSKGMLISTLVEDVRTVDMKSYRVIFVSTVTKVTQNGKSKMIRNNTYVIRGVSPQLFEPLVSITYSEKTSVFAYADDLEFIAENVDSWDDLLIIREVVEKAEARGMRRLARYSSLIERSAAILKFH